VLVTDKPLQHGRRRRGHGLHADDVSGFVQRVEQHNANWRVVPMPLSLEIDILTSLNNKQRKQLDSLISFDYEDALKELYQYHLQERISSFPNKRFEKIVALEQSVLNVFNNFAKLAVDIEIEDDLFGKVVQPSESNYNVNKRVRLSVRDQYGSRPSIKQLMSRCKTVSHNDLFEIVSKDQSGLFELKHTLDWNKALSTRTFAENDMIDRTVAGLFDKLAQLLNVKHVRFTFIDPGKFGIHLIGSDGIEMHTNLATRRRFTNTNVYKSKHNKQRCQQLLDRYFLQIAATADNDLTMKHVVFLGSGHLSEHASLIVSLLQRGLIVVLLNEHMTSQICFEHFIKMRFLTEDHISIRCSDCSKTQDVIKQDTITLKKQKQTVSRDFGDLRASLLPKKTCLFYLFLLN